MFKSTLQLKQQFLYANCVTVYQFKAKEFEIKTNTFCLGNNSKDITTDNMKISGLNGSVYNIFVAYNTITINYVKNDHKCLMKKHNVVCAGAIVVRFSSIISQKLFMSE